MWNIGLYKKQPTVFPMYFAILYSYHKCMNISVVPHPPHYLVVPTFLNFSHYSFCVFNLVVLICIFLMDFLMFIDHYCISFVNHLFNYFAHFWLGYFLLTKLWEFFRYSGCKSSVRYLCCAYFLLCYDLLCHLLVCVLQGAENFSFHEVQFINVFFNISCILCLKKLLKMSDFLLEVLWLGLWSIFSVKTNLISRYV